MSDLQGRAALVTGGGRGIGRAIALGLARSGAAVAVAARTELEIEETRRAISEAGGMSFAVKADVTSATDVARMFKAVREALGEPAIVVNNAGMAGSHKLAGHPDELWDSMIAVNLTGTYRVTREAAPALLASGWGRVINIGSVASLTGARYIAAYTAAKHGVLGLTRALAAEWALAGITVNMIAPGYVDTTMTDDTVANIAARTAMGPGEARALVERLSPMHRLVAPEEIVPLVCLLASDEAAGITGAVIPVDGGASAFAASG